MNEWMSEWMDTSAYSSPWFLTMLEIQNDLTKKWKYFRLRTDIAASDLVRTRRFGWAACLLPRLFTSSPTATPMAQALPKEGGVSIVLPFGTSHGAHADPPLFFFLRPAPSSASAALVRVPCCPGTLPRDLGVLLDSSLTFQICSVTKSSWCVGFLYTPLTLLRWPPGLTSSPLDFGSLFSPSLVPLEHPLYHCCGSLKISKPHLRMFVHKPQSASCLKCLQISGTVSFKL